MAASVRLCLNMIVKNEIANLERCLAAIVPHVDCWVISDTGSTDGTPGFIKSYFEARNLPGELHSSTFRNFEYSRNEALNHAYAAPLEYDYLLLADADMELVVDDSQFRTRLQEPGYRLLQRTDSGLAYWNTRLVRRDASARYHGVTHEYLDVPGGVQALEGVWYKDHASGSNRLDKFERDAKLLRDALKQAPDNERYWFYLAQSYRDAGRLEEAAKAYAKRAEMGGWDEEAWNALLQEARCLRRLGDEAGFLRQALAAFNRRPIRAEPLYDIARFYREKGMNDASVIFSEAGLAIKRPDDEILFLEDSVYTTGLQEEYSIAANYSPDPRRKHRGFAACNWLALNRTIPESNRNLAWSNLLFYLQTAKEIMPSWTSRHVDFSPPDGYRPLNPSIARLGDEIVLAQRVVNYTLTQDGLHYQTPDGSPIRTRNFLLRLSCDLATTSAAEILPPADMPEPVFPLVLGFEDLRLFAWRNELWGIACVREMTPQGWCEQVMGRVERRADGQYRLTDWRAIFPEGPRLHEKNWMPQVSNDQLRFIYLCDPTRILDEHGKTISETSPPISAKYFRGGSQAIWFDEGWLTLIHEVHWRAAEKRRYYLHRFVWFDSTNSLRRVSRPFFFHAKGIEFAAGLAWHPDHKRLMISFSVADGESWIATVEASDVAGLLDDAAHLPSGASPASATASISAQSRVVEEDGQGDRAKAPAVVARTTEEAILDLAPFLRAVDSPGERRDRSRDFDIRICKLLNFGGSAALPQIHSFYEVLSDEGQHHMLSAATASMRAAGHPVCVWSYTPQKLDFLRAQGVELRLAEEVIPRGLFEKIVAGSEIRLFSDIFRYAVLYEQGGLWMDSDMILLRSFPYCGDYFFNLQWRGGHKGHFVCGNVMFAKPNSHHLRALYEISIDRFFTTPEWVFGKVGPILLSDYIASGAGAELQKYLFGPTFFNPIDWTELDQFEKPVCELAEYLNDERVFGVHLWTARNDARAHGDTASLISTLSDPAGLPNLAQLADRYDTDKNRHTGNRHFYARVYDRLLSSRRLSLRRLMEIGLCRGLAEGNQSDVPSARLWQSYFPFCEVIGVDLTDFSRLNNERFTSYVCDQSKLEDLRSVATGLEPGSLDVIIDDGSHASFDQQLTLREFFPLLAEGGWYFIEDLDWQPPGEDSAKAPLTKNLLRELQQRGVPSSADPLGVSDLAGQIEEILFFDSHYELDRARLLGGLVAIRKRGGAGFVR